MSIIISYIRLSYSSKALSLMCNDFLLSHSFKVFHKNVIIKSIIGNVFFLFEYIDMFCFIVTPIFKRAEMMLYAHFPHTLLGKI